MARLSGWKIVTGAGAFGMMLLSALASSAQSFDMGRENAHGAAAAPSAVAKVTGMAAPDALLSGLAEAPVAQGSTPLENPTDVLAFYGYDGNGPVVPAPGDIQAPGHYIEASKTEPDKNTYLVLDGQKGPDPEYDYGSHFLFQGHETGLAGYVTRINLDADDRHRVTLFASEDRNGTPLPVFDGSTWDPWARRLLFTAELGSAGGVWQSTLDFPPVVEDISGILGRAGYEGIQNDSDGNLWIVEDTGGKAGAVNTHAKQPNSFLYRFVPKNRFDLTRGGASRRCAFTRSRPGCRFCSMTAGRTPTSFRTTSAT